MSANKQNAARSLDDLDPEMQAALREAARHSGMDLDEWLAANGDPARSGGMGFKAAGHPPRPNPARAASPQEIPPAGEIQSLLSSFEARLGDIAERISHASPRPVGRRGSDPHDEVLNAIAEIRSRQRDLDHAETLPLYAGRFRPAPRHPDPEPAIDAVHGEIRRLRDTIEGLATREEVGAIECSLRDLVHQLGRARGPADLTAMTAPINALQAEIRGLAEVVTNGVHGRLAADLDRVAGRIDLVAGSGGNPAGLEALVDQFTEAKRALATIADPRRIQNLVDQVAGLNGQLAEIRSRQVDAREFAALKSAVDEIRATLTSPQFGGAAPSFDFSAHFAALGRKLDHLSEQAPFAKLDAVSRRMESVASRIEQHDSEAMVSRLGDLSRKMDAFGLAPEKLFAREMEKLSGRIEGALAGRSSASSERVLEKLDRLDERLRGPQPAVDLKPLEDLVRTLADKLEQAGRPSAGSGAMDALEKQVGLLAERLERNAGRDPAIVSLEQTMVDLMAQIETLRDGSGRDRGPNAPAGEGVSEFELLKRELADIDARSAERAELRPEPLHNTLESVVSRLANLEHDVHEPPVHAGEARRSEAPRSPRPSPEAPLPRMREEILLEPGAGPPRSGGAKLDPGADIKASFIAAARRAAQAAAAEAAAAKPKGVASRLAEAGVLARAAYPGGLSARMRGTVEKHRRPLVLGLAAIVLALGALQVVGPLVTAPRTQQVAAAKFAPGPTQTGSVRESAPLSKPEPRASELAPPSPPALQDADAAAADRSAQAALFREPKSTPTPLAKSYAEPVGSGSEVQVLQITPAAPQPAVTGATDPAPSSDRIANVASLGEIPSAGVPAGLRQAALAGEPTAVYELASRLADGRGAPRDPKLAAKLFERAALHGLAPAQYRVGSHYEKGFGVGRDLTLAKLWYQRAAEKGNARAMHNLGVLLADGTGGRADYAGAAGWFRRAAELGVRDSQFNLAVLLARGLGTGQDLAQAYTWFAIAAAQGDPDSGKKRDEVAARLGPHEAAAAQAAAERWRAETPDKAANEVAPAPQSWTEAPAPKRGAGTVRG